jgi:Tol biopolymer transport system component
VLTRPQPLEFDDQPAWSPDGASVAFVRGRAPTDGRDVFVVRRDGTGLRRLTQPRSALPAYEGPAWLRDQTVLFARNSADLDDDLFVVDPGRAGARRLTDNTVRDWDPAWSPDGSLIAFVRTLESGPFGRRTQNEELFVMRADGSRVRRLTRHRYEDLGPSWSPDGSRIAFTRRVGRTGMMAIHTIRADGTALRRVAGALPGLVSGAVWSPDGRMIALVVDTGVGAGGQLWVVNSDGSRPRLVTRLADGVQGPEWSPDRRFIAITALTGCGGPCVISALYVVRPDGSGLRKLVDNLGGALAWSPDGRSLAVAAGLIVELDLRTGQTREIVRGDATHWSPDWQPRCTRAGTARSDRLAGISADELLCGFGGPDRLRGGPGRDRLFGGDGDDSIEARDRAFDVVGCGPGRDSVVVDRRDLVGEDCERVLRRDG